MISSFRQCGRAVMLVAHLTSPGWCAESRLKIEAGSHDRGPAPVVVTLPAGTAKHAKLELVSMRDGDRALPVQWVDREALTAAFVSPRLRAGQSAVYRLVARPASSSSPAVESRVQGGAILVSLRGSPVLRYNTAVVKPPPGIDAVYRRSGHGDLRSAAWPDACHRLADAAGRRFSRGSDSIRSLGFPSRFRRVNAS